MTFMTFTEKIYYCNLHYYLFIYKSNIYCILCSSLWTIYDAFYI